MRGLREGWTKHPWEWLLLLAALTLLATLVVAPRAQGDHHLMKIRQVHPDNLGMFGSGDWVELQMYAAGQDVVEGSLIRTYFSTGTLNTTFQFPANASATLANNQSQSTILVGNSSTVGGVTPDFTALDGTGANNELELIGDDGAVCFDSPIFGRIDCVSYGAFTNNTFPTGTPAVTTPFGSTLERSIAPNCSTLLEDADDTNNSSTDFAISTRNPRNNATVPTEAPCAPTPPPPPPITPTPVTFSPQGSCKGQTATLTGTASDDVLVGTPRKDVIAGLEGNDTLRGLNGKDLLCGGLGNDKLIGGNAKDTLLGEGGSDTCKGGKAKDVARTCEVKRGI